MRRRLRKPKSGIRAVEPSSLDAASFDGALTKELRDPTLVDISLPLEPSPNGSGLGLEIVYRSPMPAVSPTLPKLPPYQQNSPAIDFWAQYDQATAAADLLAVPPAAVITVVGPLEVAIPVAKRCRSQHWAGDGKVFVLSDRAHIAAEPTWTILRQADDLLGVLEDDRHDSPLLVLDVPHELPHWVSDLVAMLRQGGIGLVHYVLDGEPTDEDLATWHGELGRPAVLDLASPIEPERVIRMLERGEPIASIAGVPITAELLLALHMEVFS